MNAGREVATRSVSPPVLTATSEPPPPPPPPPALGAPCQRAAFTPSKQEAKTMQGLPPPHPR